MSLNLDQAIQRAIAAHHAGDLQQAEQLYRAILAANPHHGDAHHNLGVLAASVGKIAEGLPYFKAALASSQDQPQFWISYIAALISVGDVTSAIRILQEARARGLDGSDFKQLEADLARQSHPPGEMIAQLNAAFTQNAWEVAETLAQTMRQQYPQHPSGWHIGGCIFAQTGRPERAAPLFERLAVLCPNDASVHSNLGSVLRDIGQLTLAESHCRQAIQISPDFADAYYNLGNILRDLDSVAESELSYREAIRINPAFAAAFCNLGNLLRENRHLKESVACFREAVLISPDFSNAWCNLGNALQDMGHMEESIESYHKALQLNADSAESHNNLGSALREIGQYAAAETHYHEALRINPDLALAQSNLLFLHSSHAMTTAQQYLDAARAFGRKVSSRATPKFSTWRTERDPCRLRVGLVSGDLRNHPVGYFLEGLCKQVDTSRIEFFGFPTQSIEDDLTGRLKRLCHRWVPVVALRDEAASRVIHDQGIHVLIDLAGHTADNRLGVFAYKPAPLQVSWLGYWASTGLPEMDYVLGDPLVLPMTEASHFSEATWRLPETYLCFTPPSQNAMVGPLPCLKSGILTFGCFNNPAKMGDRVVEVWARILRSLPHSQLFLKAKQFGDDLLTRDVIHRFAAHGIAAERLLFEGYTERGAYLEAYQRVDLALDPFPYHGGTTTAEALWMGVPVLTKRGDRFLSHIGESIAHNSGQPDWIAGDDDDYVAKAIAFGSSPDRLAAIRSGLRHQVLASPLFDAPRFARSFETALWDMWRVS
jgi:protein O-GlcNAc transferase